MKKTVKTNVSIVLGIALLCAMLCLALLPFGNAPAQAEGSAIATYDNGTGKITFQIDGSYAFESNTNYLVTKTINEFSSFELWFYRPNLEHWDEEISTAEYHGEEFVFAGGDRTSQQTIDVQQCLANYTSGEYSFCLTAEKRQFFLWGSPDGEGESAVVVDYTAPAHSHCQCGKAVCNTAGHDAVNYVPYCPIDLKWTKNNNMDGNFYLTQDVDLSTLVEGMKVAANANSHLCLNGHKITGYSNSATAAIEINNGTLTICDCSAEEHRFSVSTQSGGEGLFVSDPHGDQVVVGGVITGRATDGASKGILIKEDGTLNMYGGNLVGNKDGGVEVLGTFNMFGGSIVGNVAQSKEAIVLVRGGKFNLSGQNAIIAKNRVHYQYQSGATVQISSNHTNTAFGTMTITEGSIKENQGNWAGGVYVSTGCSFNMFGGSISNNVAGSSGGGIYLQPQTTAIVSKGRIENNSASEFGGGIFAESGIEELAFIAGITSITGNVARDGAGLYLSGNLLDPMAETEINVSGGIIIKDNKNGTSADAKQNNVFLGKGVYLAYDEFNGLEEDSEIGVHVDSSAEVFPRFVLLHCEGAVYEGSVPYLFADYNPRNWISYSQEDGHAYLDGIVVDNVIINGVRMEYQKYLPSNVALNDVSALTTEKPTETGYAYLDYDIETRQTFLILHDFQLETNGCTVLGMIQGEEEPIQIKTAIAVGSCTTIKLEGNNSIDATNGAHALVGMYGKRHPESIPVTIVGTAEDYSDSLALTSANAYAIDFFDTANGVDPTPCTLTISNCSFKAYASNASALAPIDDVNEWIDCTINYELDDGEPFIKAGSSPSDARAMTASDETQWWKTEQYVSLSSAYASLPIYTRVSVDGNTAWDGNVEFGFRIALNNSNAILRELFGNAVSNQLLPIIKSFVNFAPGSLTQSKDVTASLTIHNAILSYLQQHPEAELSLWIEMDTDNVTNGLNWRSDGEQFVLRFADGKLQFVSATEARASMESQQETPWQDLTASSPIELSYHYYKHDGATYADVVLGGVRLAFGKFLASGATTLSDTAPTSGGFAMLMDYDGEYYLQLNNYSNVPSGASVGNVFRLGEKLVDGISDEFYMWRHEEIGLYSKVALQIKVEGNNKIDSTSFCIKSVGDLDFDVFSSGEQKLELSGVYQIVVDNGNGNLAITSCTILGTKSTQTFIQAETVSIFDSKIEVSRDDGRAIVSGFASKGGGISSFTIRSSTVTIPSCTDYAFQTSASSGHVTIKNSTVNAGGAIRGLTVTFENSNVNLTLAESSAKTSAIEAEGDYDGEININASTIVTNGAIESTDSITISNADVNENGATVNKGSSVTVNAKNGVEYSLKGRYVIAYGSVINVDKTIFASAQAGILWSDATITTSNDYALSAAGSVIMLDSTFVANAQVRGSNFIMADSNVTVTDDERAFDLVESFTFTFATPQFGNFTKDFLVFAGDDESNVSTLTDPATQLKETAYRYVQIVIHEHSWKLSEKDGNVVAVCAQSGTQCAFAVNELTFDPQFSNGAYGVAYDGYGAGENDQFQQATGTKLAVTRYVGVGNDYDSDQVPTNAGTYKVVFEGEGFSFDNWTFTIEPKEIQDDLFDAFDEDQFALYNGSEQGHPTLVVASQHASLITSDDYEITGETSATLNGTYTITITGKNNLSGSITRTWKIKGNDFESGDYTIVNYEQAYDAQPHTVTVTSSVNDYVVLYSETEDGDYSSTPIEYVNVGNYTVWVKISAIGYNETQPQETSINISPKQIYVTVISQEIVYGSDNVAYISTSLFGSDEITGNARIVCAGDRPDVGGPYAVTQGTLAVGSNYELVFESNDAEITVVPRVVTIDWGQTQFIARESAITDGLHQYVVTPTITNLVGEDTATLELSNTEPFRDRRAWFGEFTAKIIGVDNANYTIDGASNLTRAWSIVGVQTDAEPTVSDKATTQPKTYYTASDTVVLTAPDGYQISFDCTSWFTAIDVDDNTSKQVKYHLKNSDGNVTDEKTINVPFELEGPTYEVTINGKTAVESNEITLFYRAPATIVVNAQDDASGVDVVLYQLIANWEDFPNEQAWQTYSEALTNVQAGKYVLYVKGSDVAGTETTYTTAKFVVFDNIVETLKVTNKISNYDTFNTNVTLGEHTVNQVLVNETPIDSSWISNLNGRLLLDGQAVFTLTLDDVIAKVIFNPYGVTYVANEYSQEPSTTITIKIERWQPNLHFVESHMDKEYDGNEVDQPYVDCDNTDVEVTYEYKVKGASDDTYVTNAPKEPGEYTVRISVEETAIYEAESKELNFVISKIATYATGWGSMPASYNGAPITAMETQNVISNSGCPTADYIYEYKLSTEGDDKYVTTAPTNAGSYDVRITIPSTDHYTSFTEVQVLVVSQIDVKNAIITLGQSLTFNGSEQTQTIASVQVGDFTLATTDYTISGNVGTQASDYYELTITGTGNFTGTETKTWSIAKGQRNLAFTTDNFNKEYDGSQVAMGTEDFSFDGTGTCIVEYKVKGASDDTYTDSRFVDAGQYVVRLTIDADDNYLGASITKEFAISAKSISNAIVKLNGDLLVADGTEKTQVVQSVELDELTVTYEVTGNVNVNAGDYELTITGTGNFTGSITRKYVILAPTEDQLTEETNDDGKTVVVIGEGSINVDVKKGTEETPDASIVSDKAQLIGDILSGEDLAKIANGEDYEIWVEIVTASIENNLIDETIADAMKEIVANQSGKCSIGTYVDIKMFRQLASEAQASGVFTLENGVTISITVPEEMRKEGRTYFVVRNHDGQVDIIGGDYNAETFAISFETDRFSAYAIGYQDYCAICHERAPGALDLCWLAWLVIVVVALALIAVAILLARRFATKKGNGGNDGNAHVATTTTTNKPTDATPSVAPVAVEQAECEEDDDDEDEEVVQTEGGSFARYNKSFTAKLIQASPEVQSLYAKLKNHLLGYKKVHSRISWKNDSFNHGRAPIAKFAIRGKSLFIYLPLTGEEIEATSITKLAKAKHYDSVKSFTKITGTVSYNRAIKAIDLVCARLGIEFTADQTADYLLPYETTEALIEKGLIKVLKLRKPSFATVQEQQPVQQVEQADEDDDDDDEDEEVVQTEGGSFARYNKSFTAKLIQASPEVQALYGAIKNHLLGYDKVHSRISWKNDSFNHGRAPIAKFAIRGKSLFIYLPLTAEEIEATSITKLSKAKHYDSVKSFTKITGTVSHNRVTKGIDLVCARLGIKFNGDQTADYSLPYETTEALIAKALIKVLKQRVAVTVAEARTAMTDSTAISHVVTKELVSVGTVKAIVNIDTIGESFADGETVDVNALKAKKLVPQKADYVKVLARGTLSKAINVIADDYSVDAVKMIVLAGGTATRLVKKSK